MKKWMINISAALVFCFLAGAMAGCGKANKESALDRIKKSGKIVVGTGIGYLPFNMTNKNGELVGYDIDVAKALAKELGVKVEFQNYPFSSIIPALQANKIDVAIYAMTITDKRKEVVDFSDPYFTSGQALLVNKSCLNVKTLQDLDKEGNVVAVVMGTTGDRKAMEILKKATVKKFEGTVLAGLELLNGNATALITEIPWVAIYNKLNPGKTYAVLEPFTTENLGIAVPKSEPELLNAVNKFVKKYRASEDYQKACDYWFVDMTWWDTAPNKK